jgi:hypothetical protein
MMTSRTIRSARVGLVAWAVAALTAGIGGDAVAKAHKGHLHARSELSDSHAQLVAPEPVRLGPMRYYGGPKSPMWRGPAEN